MEGEIPLYILISIEYHRIEDSWNVMSVDIRTAHCTKSFKFKVKKFLMDKS